MRMITFNVTAGDSFSNYVMQQSMRITSMLQQGITFLIGITGDSTINANNFNVTAGGYFSNRYNANIIADSFNVTAGYTDFTIIVMQQSVRITSMLQQEVSFYNTDG